jgi:hypothetical protein
MHDLAAGVGVKLPQFLGEVDDSPIRAGRPNQEAAPEAPEERPGEGPSVPEVAPDA